MNNAQRKSTDAELRAKKKYANSKYRPNVFMDKELESDILKRVEELGYRSFNEYVGALIEFDLKNGLCPRKE